MLEEIHSLIEKIGKVPGAYLVSCFLMNDTWRIDYYSPTKHKIITYFIEGGKLEHTIDNIFQKEQKPLEELQLKKIKVSYSHALKKVRADTDKSIIILQVIEGKIVWNITVLTPEFHVYNLKVDAVTGKTLSEEEENIMNFKKDGPSFTMSGVSA